jgi:menaquinone-dependent protoporphyrinogen oxidase
MTTILVAYASKHDSTGEIANAIGETLRKIEGFQVDVQSAEIIESVAGYDAVVLGSAVYAGQWQKAAAEFLKRFEAELSQRPVWLFSSGPTGEGDPKALMNGWTFPESLKPVAENIKPREIAVFHGKLDPADLNFFERSVVKMVHAPMGDARDWPMIEGWATGIAEALVGEERVESSPTK